jgi:hypothetical protein
MDGAMSHSVVSASIPTMAVVAIAGLALSAEPAAAYIGPGAGLTAVGAAIALIAAIALAVVGFIWYPARRAARRLFGKQKADAAGTNDRPAGDAASVRARE